MPAEDLVQQAIAALRERRIDDFVALTHVEAEARVAFRPARTVYYGRDGMRAMAHDLLSRIAEGRHLEFEGAVSLSGSLVELSGAWIHDDGGRMPVRGVIEVRDELIYRLDAVELRDDAGEAG